VALVVRPRGTVSASTGHWFRQRTLAAVAQAMGALGEAAHASFGYDMSATPRGDSIASVDLTVRLSMEMPAWAHVRRRPQAEQREWNRFLRALRYHEDGHIAIYRREAETSYQRLLEATPETINDVLQAEIERVQRVNDEYDRTNHHGQRQSSPHGTTVIQVP